jgi:Ca2+-transporting ATPase
LFLFSAVAGAFAVQLAGVYLPGLQHLLGTEALDVTELLITIAVSAIGWLAAQAIVVASRSARAAKAVP